MSAPRVGVCGLGLIGGSALLALRAAGLAVRGCDADAGARAWCDGLGVPVDDDVGRTARACDVLLVCVPPGATASVVVAALLADPGVVVLDAASVKGPVVRDVRERAAGDAHRFLPAHPLAGAESHGHAAAREDLLRDATWAVCPPADRPAGAGAPATTLLRVAPVLDALDGRILVCTPEEHDRALAASSHAPHVVAGAVAETAAVGPTGGPVAAVLSGGALRDATRVAAAPAGLWAEILGRNAERTADALEAVAERLRSAAEALRAGDADAVRAGWERGGTAHDRIRSARWTAPDWSPVVVADGWGGLLGLGAAGTVLRRLREGGDGSLAAEAWTTAG